MKNIILTILLVALVLGSSFGITALLVKGICWAFNWNFSLKIACGVWLALFLLKHISIKVDKE